METNATALDLSDRIQTVSAAAGRRHLLVAAGPEGSSSSATSSIHVPFRDATSQIRLLKAINKGADDPLTFELLTVDFDQKGGAPTYYAISYTWGENENRRTITLNDHDFVVSQNCYYALWQARLHCAEVLIWIDAVCINQTDLAEKSEQVAMMGEIYRRAGCVLVCVGPHADDSELILPWAEKTDTILKASGGEDNDASNKALQKMDNEKKTLHAAGAFSRRAYWQRLWVVQEIQLGRYKSVLCGDDVIPWSLIRGLRRTMWRFEVRIESSYDSRAPKTDREPGSNAFLALVSSPSLETLLSLEQALDRYHDFECEDPRDRIYGLLSLIEKREELRPDYSLTEFALALKVARWVDLEHIPTLLRALNLSCRSDQRGLFLECRNHHYKICRRALYSMVDNARVCYSLHGLQYYHSIYVLKVDERGNLQVDNGLEDFYDSLLDERLSFAGNALHNWEDAKRPFPGLLNAKRLMSGSHHVGLICKEAQSKDIVVQYYGNLFLVLRCSGDEIYDIVGKGFFIEQDNMFSKVANVTRRLYDVDVSLSVGEAVALLAFEGYGAERKSWLEILTDRIEYFRYPVTALPGGASRVCLRPSPSSPASTPLLATPPSPPQLTESEKSSVATY